MQKAVEEATQKAIEVTTQKNKIETARNFKKLGVANDIIKQATGLTDEEIEKL